MRNIEKAEKKQRAVLEKLMQLSQTIAYSNLIVLLLDISGSMSGEKIEDAKRALIRFLKTIDLTKNKISIVTFGGSVRVTEFDQRAEYLIKKINSFEAGGGTPLMAAISIGYKNLLKEGAEVKSAMVIATDGEPTDAEEDEILEYGKEIKVKGTRIVTIGIGTDCNKTFLRKLASSPEDYHFAKESFELEETYKKIANDLALPEEGTGKEP